MDEYDRMERAAKRDAEAEVWNELTALRARAEAAEATVVVLMSAIQKYFNATPDEMVATIVALKNASDEAQAALTTPKGVRLTRRAARRGGWTITTS